eukprot:368389_1
MAHQAELFYSGRIRANSKLAQPPTSAHSDRSQNWMVMENGKITHIGENTPPPPVLSRVPEKFRHDLGGRVILPGLHDAHCHIGFLGRCLGSLSLRGCTSIDKMKELVRKYCADHPEVEFVVANSWDQSVLGRFPTKFDFDEVCPDKPLIAPRVCWHVGVLNSKALSILASEKTNDPDVCHSTGMATETSFDDIVEKMEGFVSHSQRKTEILRGLRECRKVGLTAVQTNDAFAWKIYKELADEGKLPCRVFLTIPFCEMGAKGSPKANEKYGNMLSCHRVKLFVDGALGASTAALTRPYLSDNSTTEQSGTSNNGNLAAQHSDTSISENPTPHHSGTSKRGNPTTSNRGMLVTSEDELAEKIRRAGEAGFRVEIHVIGDRAADVALEALRKAGVSPERRPILTHCQILRDDLLKRLKYAGVVANIQPSFVKTDSTWIHQKVDTKLLSYSYAWKQLLKAGIHCAGGSDAPVETINPLLGIYDAIFRPVGERADVTDGYFADPKKCFRPKECLTFDESVQLYTSGAAFSAGEESTLGQLRPGFNADFVVINTPDNGNVLDNPALLLQA